MALGVKEMEQGKTQFLHLKPHDLLLLYTDGILEAMNSKEEMYGKKKFLRDVQEAQGKNPDDLVASLANNLNRIQVTVSFKTV